MSVVIKAQVEIPAWPRRLMPKKINAAPDAQILFSGMYAAELESTEKKVSARAGFHPRNISEVVAYDNTIHSRNMIFEYHLLGLDRWELETRRRFELKVSRSSYWRVHRNDVM